MIGLIEAYTGIFIWALLLLVQISCFGPIEAYTEISSLALLKLRPVVDNRGNRGPY